jgi:hypothetical protein
MKYIILLLVFLFPMLAGAQAWSEPNMEEVCKVTDCSVITPPQSNLSVLEAVAWCESGNDPLAKNPRSTASGRFQFLKSSWNYYGKKLWGEELKNKNVFDYEDNTALAVWVYNRNGLVDWEESKPCWSKLIQ